MNAGVNNCGNRYHDYQQQNHDRQDAPRRGGLPGNSIGQRLQAGRDEGGPLLRRRKLADPQNDLNFGDMNGFVMARFIRDGLGNGAVN